MFLTILNVVLSLATLVGCVMITKLVRRAEGISDSCLRTLADTEDVARSMSIDYNALDARTSELAQRLDGVATSVRAIAETKQEEAPVKPKAPPKAPSKTPSKAPRKPSTTKGAK